ncbi:MAG: alginate export family protein [Candidatus Omnitrophica bacterium]|nr:alginate export family protein [Candidatus Omnitrophota bacterium]
MKRMLIILLAVSMVAVMIMPAFAEVQNIKVGGGVNIKGFLRDNYLTTGSGGGRMLTGFQNAETRDWYNTITKLAVNADLTDNVEASIVLANERDWQNAATNSGAVNVYCSYVTLKEMLYSPLTVKAGKMPVKIADGLMLGDGSISEQYLGSDYALSSAFNTIHGILDYDPLTLIVGTMKFSDAAQSSSDDIDGYLIDAIYKFEDDMKSVLDVYVINAHYNSPQATTTGPTGTSTNAVDVYAIAGTLNSSPIEGVATKLGLAYQFGDYQKIHGGTNRDLKAYAIDVAVNYSVESEYSPKVGVKYVYRSGQDSSGTTGDYKGWLALYESQVNGVIYDPNTNTNSIALTGSVVPMDRLTVGLEWWWYNLAKKQSTETTANSSKKDAGAELDLYAKYAYTEDVSLGLNVAWFFPGDYYKSGYDKTAMQVMAELGVAF